MFKQPKKPEVLGQLGGLLLGLAVVLASDQVREYGYALAALILAIVCMRPMFLQIYHEKDDETETENNNPQNL